MGSGQSKNKINYEDVQHACKFSLKNKTDQDNYKYIIINTMDKNWQSCLIQNTIAIQEEEEIINGILNDKFSKSTTIIIYGTNSNDESIYSKYDQLVKATIQTFLLYK